MRFSSSRRGPELRRRTDRLPKDIPLPPIYRLRPEPKEQVPLDPLARDADLARLEAALMLADEPLAARKLATVCGLPDAASVRRLVQKLREFYDKGGSAFQVEELAGGYQLLSRPRYHPWLARWRRSGSDNRLSGAGMETLAIVAYKQPIMRAEIEKVRGVQCGELLGHLMEKGLIRIAGRHDSLGRPVLYGTTKKFLQVFGLNAIRDLPEIGKEKST